MSRIHRVTHPTLGIVSWSQIQKFQRESSHGGLKICLWCHGLVPRGHRTRCGKKECDDRITELVYWAILIRKMFRESRECALCGGRAKEIDHIVPMSLGGTSDRGNLRRLCIACHKTETARLKKEKGAYVAAVRPE